MGIITINVIVMTAEPQLPTAVSSSSSSSSPSASNNVWNKDSSPAVVVVVDDVDPHKSTLSAVKLESSSSDCNGNAIIAAAPAPREDTHDNSYVFVPSYHDDSPLSLPLDHDNSYRNKQEDPDTGPQESPVDIPNGKLVTTHAEFAASSITNQDSLNKADDTGAENQDSLNEAHDTDALASATQVILQNATVEASAPHQLGHQQIDSDSSPASGNAAMGHLCLCLRIPVWLGRMWLLDS